MTQQRTVRKRERESQREKAEGKHIRVAPFTQDATDVSNFVLKQNSSHSALSRCSRLDLYPTQRTPAVVSGGLAQVT